MNDGSVGNNFNSGGDNVIGGAGRFKKAGSTKGPGDVKSNQNLSLSNKKDISRSTEADSGKPIQVTSSAQNGMVLAGDFNPVGKGNFIQLQGGKTDTTESKDQGDQLKLTVLEGGKSDEVDSKFKVTGNKEVDDLFAPFDDPLKFAELVYKAERSGAGDVFAVSEMNKVLDTALANLDSVPQEQFEQAGRLRAATLDNFKGNGSKPVTTQGLIDLFNTPGSEAA